MARSRIIRALVAVTGAGLLAVSAASMASAAPAKPGPAAPSAAADAPNGPVTAAVPASCPSGSVCFWADANFVDGPGHLSGSNASWFAFSHSSCSTKGTAGAVWADCASSVANNGVNCTAHLYYLTDFGLPKLDVLRGVSFANLTQKPRPNGGNWNDNIESNNWC